MGPKIYALLQENGSTIIKIKGFKNSMDIDFKDFKSLLHRESSGLDLTHQKWFRSLNNESIYIKDQIYHLIATENKRKIIYDDKG